MSQYQWLNDKYVTKWFNEVSERTRKNAIEPFNEWLQFVKMSPTQQVEKRIKDLQNPNPQVRRFFEDKLIEWSQHLQSITDSEGKRKYTSSAVHTKIQRVMRFFSHNSLPLQVKGQLNIEPTEREKVSLKWVSSNAEVRLLYKYASLRDKPLLLALYQSGFSEIDVSCLRIEHFPQIYTCESHHYIAKRREKTNEWQQTCISQEAIHDLRILLHQRGKPQKGFLFVTHLGKQISVRSINIAMKKLAEKTFGTERAKEFQTKNLRDSYKNGLLSVKPKLDTEIVDVMFGHKRSGAKASYQIGQQLIEDSYIRVFEHLSVNHGTQAKADLQRLEEQQESLAEVIAKQQAQIKRMEDKLEDLPAQTILKLMKHLEELGLAKDLLKKKQH